MHFVYSGGLPLKFVGVLMNSSSIIECAENVDFFRNIYHTHYFNPCRKIWHGVYCASTCFIIPFSRINNYLTITFYIYIFSSAESLFIILSGNIQIYIKSVAILLIF